ncbi:hypothetical protein [Aquirufa antheringensis]|jgi:hypothetical protein|uniref:hypothetical protein n=1 Tax=Aquirufa antheringensis TaxID=2516559 RepID=UPI0022A9108A|nr:hypothetical protein [Aquirufa antheringensis]MCZ2484694.1 hypothetical protein [Aquirufa antheringensis]
MRHNTAPLFHIGLDFYHFESIIGLDFYHFESIIGLDFYHFVPVIGLDFYQNRGNTSGKFP